MEAVRTTTIRATNRMSVKVKDNFYTVEWCEERTVPADISAEELAEARKALWNICIQECENQVEDIVATYR